MKKLIGFDLDGTLTQHKSPLSQEAKQLLEKLSEKYRLLMVGAGACERIYKQMNQFPIEIIGNYGMQRSEIKDGVFHLVENQTVSIDRERIEGIVTGLRKRFHFEEYAGENVEFHASGVITFPILGTKAALPQKLAYDPDRKKRRAIYREVCKAFAGFNVFIGGSSSFDITPLQYDKFHALERFCQQTQIALDEVLYVGDDFGEGGNDSQVRLGGIDYVEIEDYHTTPEKLAYLL